MAKIQAPFYSLNAGEVSRDALARIDLDKMRLASEQMENLVPTVLGPMQFRPGTIYVGQTNGNAKARLIDFIFSADQTALIEVGGSKIRVWHGDTLVTRPGCSAHVNNGNFGSAMGTGWADRSGTGSTATINTTSQQMTLSGGSFSSARVTNSVNVDPTEHQTLHSLKIKVKSGPILFSVGSDVGLDDIVQKTYIGQGTHSIGFTPGVAQF